MKKSIILTLVGVVAFIALIVGLWFWSSRYDKENKEATPVTTDIIFFYGEQCPHCKDVEKFLSENKIAEKVKFDSLEVWSNQKNNDLLIKKAQECGLKKEDIGIPLIYSKGQCLVGAPDIEKFFKEKAGI